MNTAIEPVSVLFAQVLLFWHAANYLLSADPVRKGRRDWRSSAAIRRLGWFAVRAACAGALTFAVCGRRSGIVLAGLMSVGCLLLPVARWLWTPARYLAELEILANVAFITAAQAAIVHFDLHSRWMPFHPSLSEGLLAACTITAALLIFVVRGGTFIVRGVLNRAGTMPPPELDPRPQAAAPSAFVMGCALPVDAVELNHGRLIGNIERLILVLFVANEQYTALAFFFAAKGLIRSKDVQRRAWADYLILGSLTSFLVAVVSGLLIQAVFRFSNP